MRGLRDPGLWLLLNVRPPGDRRHDARGRCSVCGDTTRFVRNRWILSADLVRRWTPALIDRESMLCSSCGCNRRVRRMAEVLVDLYAEGATSVAELVREAPFAGLRIAEVNSIGRMHPFLAAVPGLVHVEYPEEDIQSLSWADESFDLVLTSETLEHVPDPGAALRETFRVLRPGGRHVFTVPLHPDVGATVSRSGLPPEHHGRGGGPFALVTRRADMLVHTDFGPDLLGMLGDVGFDATRHGSGMDAVFEARRPVTP